MERKLNSVHRQGGALGESWRVSAIVYHWKKISLCAIWGSQDSQIAFLAWDFCKQVQSYTLTPNFYCHVWKVSDFNHWFEGKKLLPLSSTYRIKCPSNYCFIYSFPYVLTSNTFQQWKFLSRIKECLPVFFFTIFLESMPSFTHSPPLQEGDVCGITINGFAFINLTLHQQINLRTLLNWLPWLLKVTYKDIFGNFLTLVQNSFWTQRFKPSCLWTEASCFWQ